MDDITKAILLQLKTVSQKFGYDARVYEHESNINKALSYSYMIATKQKSIDVTLQLIWTIPKSSPNLVRATCIQAISTNGSQPHSITTMHDLDLNQPDFFSLAEDVFILYDRVLMIQESVNEPA